MANYVCMPGDITEQDSTLQWSYKMGRLRVVKRGILHIIYSLVQFGDI